MIDFRTRPWAGEHFRMHSNSEGSTSSPRAKVHRRDRTENRLIFFSVWPFFCAFLSASCNYNAHEQQILQTTVCLWRCGIDEWLLIGSRLQRWLLLRMHNVSPFGNTIDLSTLHGRVSKRCVNDLVRGKREKTKKFQTKQWKYSQGLRRITLVR